MIKKIENRK